VSISRLRTFSPVAASSLRALRERVGADRGEQIVGGVQLVAGVEPPVLAAKPLAVEQVGPGELGPQLGTAKPLDRLGVAALGLLAFADQPAARCLPREVVHQRGLADPCLAPQDEHRAFTAADPVQQAVEGFPVACTPP
jgi:hypothetical protein